MSWRNASGLTSCIVTTFWFRSIISSAKCESPLLQNEWNDDWVLQKRWMKPRRQQFYLLVVANRVCHYHDYSLFYAWLDGRRSHTLHRNFRQMFFFCRVRACAVCIRTIEHCVEVWTNRCQYNAMSIHGFAADIEDDITQLYVRRV